MTDRAAPAGPTPAIDHAAWRADTARDLLQTHGWLVVRGVLTGPDLAEAQEGFDRFLGPALRPDTRNNVWQLPGAARHDPALRAWCTGALLGRMAAELLQSPRVQLLQEVLIRKPARIGGEVAWHHDEMYNAVVEPAAGLSVRLALGDEDDAHGGMVLLDGSHRWALPDDALRIGHPMLEQGLDLLDAADRARVDAARRCPVLRAGDVSIHLGRTWHMSVANRTDTDRRTVVAHVLDGRGRLARERLPDSARWHFPTDDQDRLHPDRFPVLPAA